MYHSFLVCFIGVFKQPAFRITYASLGVCILLIPIVFFTASLTISLLLTKIHSNSVFFFLSSLIIKTLSLQNCLIRQLSFVLKVFMVRIILIFIVYYAVLIFIYFLIQMLFRKMLICPILDLNYNYWSNLLSIILDYG